MRQKPKGYGRCQRTRAASMPNRWPKAIGTPQSPGRDPSACATHARRCPWAGNAAQQLWSLFLAAVWCYTPAPAMPAAARRHPLLLYARLFALWRAPALLTAALSAVMVVWVPGPLDAVEVRAGLLGLSAVSLLIFGYALIGPRLAYVQCRANHVLLSTPLFRLAISYNRIRTTRPIPFEPERVRWSDQRLVGPFLGRTMLGLDLTAYPISRRWLRFWLMSYLLPHNFQGLQLLVPDWMALSRDIEGQRTAWKTRQREAKREKPLTSLTGHQR